MASFVYITDSITKTYACNEATITSKAVTAIVIKLHNIWIAPNTYISLKVKKTKPESILISACPDNMFANKRIAILTILAKYDIVSTIIIKSKSGPETPFGKKKFKKF